MYYIRVNEYESQTFRSAVGIPHGSVISPALCNLYTHDSMEGVEGKHTGYADDVNLWTIHDNLTEAGAITNRDLNTRVKPWCSKWNMSVAAEETDVVVVTQDGQVPNNMIDIKLGDKKLKVVKSKKILGVIIDDQLNFRQQVQERVNAGFRALKGLDNFVKGHRGCCQSVYLRLYNALVLPVMDFGVPVTVTATSECITEMGKVQRAAMLKASGCLNSTCTDALEVITNTVPIDLYLKMRQAQEVVRISVKHDEDPLKKEFQEWAADRQAFRRKPTVFQLLMCRFKEMKGPNIDFDSIEKEFKYTKEF